MALGQKDPNYPKSCVWVTHNVILALYSLCCRQLNKPQRICKYIEFKKEWPKRFKCEIAVKPGQNTLEIGIEENKPYILVNQEQLKKRFAEWLFVPLVLLAAARKKNKKLNKITDLLLPEWPKKEQLLTEIRQFLMTATFKTQVDSTGILPSDGRGNIELKVFERDFITIGHSICKFESQHMARTEKAVEEILQSLKTGKAQDLSYRADVETQISVSRLEQEARLTFRHTRIVIKAVEMIGWKFQNKNWWKRWNNLLTKCRVLFDHFGYDEKRMEEEIYLPQRGHH